MKLTKRKGFNFFRSYYDVYNELNDKDKVLFMGALLDRQFLGIKPDNLKGMAKFAYISQINSIDSQVKGYEDKLVALNKNVQNYNPWVGVNEKENTPKAQEKGKGKGEEKVEEQVEVEEKEQSFNVFWDIYNKKTDTKKCKDKFLKLSTVDIAKILLVVKNYVLSTPDLKYRKNALTWLNGQCWNDELDNNKNTSNKPKKPTF